MKPSKRLTYSELEEKCLGLEIDLEQANDTIEMLKDNIGMNDGREDDFE
ncbi:hypothetical protein [Clostridium sp.]